MKLNRNRFGTSILQPEPTSFRTCKWRFSSILAPRIHKPITRLYLHSSEQPWTSAKERWENIQTHVLKRTSLCARKGWNKCRQRKYIRTFHRRLSAAWTKETNPSPKSKPVKGWWVALVSARGSMVSPDLLSFLYVCSLKLTRNKKSSLTKNGVTDEFYWATGFPFFTEKCSPAANQSSVSKTYPKVISVLQDVADALRAELLPTRGWRLAHRRMRPFSHPSFICLFTLLPTHL